ncbi:MAG: hypothetical protein QOD48_381, partial [Gaiellaceae bacterium]|nr:hypothetical protein [Gaiellaceae bacterium]
MSTPSESQVAIAPRTLVTLAALAFGGVLVLILAQAIRGILTQLVVAIVLAMALEPLVKLFERRGLRRGPAVAATFSLAVLTITLFAWLLIPPLVTETTHLIQNAPALVQKLSHGQGRLGFLEHRFHVVERARAAVGNHGGGDVIGSGGPAIGVIRGVVATGA